MNDMWRDGETIQQKRDRYRAEKIREQQAEERELLPPPDPDLMWPTYGDSLGTDRLFASVMFRVLGIALFVYGLRYGSAYRDLGILLYVMGADPLWKGVIE